MNLVFVHGWSVTNTDTYGSLHKALSAAASTFKLDITVQHIYLGKYLSFHDEVSLDDIARAFDKALRDLPGNTNKIRPFSAITHSTGGPVVRYWQELFYGARNLAASPLRHLLMLAPANHGSALAALGKKRVGRLKAWFSGVESGQGVLDWLCLGSDGQWQLNESTLSYKNAQNNFFPFVLTGQGIDTSFYDFLNNYLVESGSDGVVRVCGANLNYRFLALQQEDEVLRKKPLKTRLLAHQTRPLKTSAPVPLGVFSQYSHCGDKMGIMRSPVASKTRIHPVVSEILKCLTVKNARQYNKRFDELAQLSELEQAKKPGGKKDRISQYTMLVLNVHDQYGNQFSRDDVEVVLLGGASYSPAQLPEGFLVDRQLNNQSNRLVFFLDAQKMKNINQGLFGIRIIARPQKGFAYYNEGEFRSEGLPLEKVFTPNQTTYVDITMKRLIDKNVFRLRRGKQRHEDFSGVQPAGKTAN